MKHGSNSRRPRGGRNGGGNNNGRRGGNSRAKVFDSNGPDVRIRGNASQVYEKYVTLAKDASSGGDRVLAESYLQHAEHYQRVLNEIKTQRITPDQNTNKNVVKDLKGVPQPEIKQAENATKNVSDAKVKPSDAIKVDAVQEDTGEKEAAPRKRVAKKVKTPEMA